jgi:hypothetical protein
MIPIIKEATELASILAASRKSAQAKKRPLSEILTIQS